MRKISIRIIVATLIAGLVLTACNLSTSPSSPAVMEAEVASTVSARLTQIVVQTMIAEGTRLAEASPTPTLTETPEITFTPTATSTATVTYTPTIPTSTPVPPTSTPVPIPCNAATYVADITIKDGTSMVAGQNFIKTWRVSNSGSCNWTTGYTLYFVSGNAMSAPASVALSKTVKPGEMIDLSVSMVAPGTSGDYVGYWMMKAPNGSVFGVGTDRNTPLYVQIKVTSIPTPKDSNTIYDFVGNYCQGQWRTNAGFISCPTNGYDYKNGTISRSYSPVLENGTVDDEGALITIPSIGGDGFIQGQFPKILIHSGDHFKATLLCSYNMPKCSVTFELSAMVSGTTTSTTLGTWSKVYDGGTVPVDVDLSAMDGQEIIFFLRVKSQGDPTNDFAQWMAARITH